MGSGEHQHCAGCFNRNCSSEEDGCRVVDCTQQCGARFHACKEEEHLQLCSRVVVPCVNSQHGCPFSFDRRKLNSHLGHCPANVVCCSHVWFRRNRKEREEGEMPSDPPLPTNYIDFALAYRDQDQIGGAKGLDECTVSARPPQRVCCGVDMRPRSESVHTLTEPCFAQGASTVPVPALACTGDEGQEIHECVSVCSRHDDQSSSISTPGLSEEVSSNHCSDSEDSHMRVHSQAPADTAGSKGAVTDSSDEESLLAKSRRPTTGSGTHENTNAPRITPATPESLSTSLPANLSPRISESAVVSQATGAKGGLPAGRKGTGLVKLFGFRHGAGGISGSANSVLREVGSSDNDSTAGSAVTSGELDAFHASMGTKLRSHVQNSKRKIAKVFSGKILHRTSINQMEPTTTRSMKRKLNAHPTLDSSQDNLTSLEVVTHGDSFVVSDDNSSAGTSPFLLQQRSSLEGSVRSDASLLGCVPQIRNRLVYEKDRSNPTRLFTSQQILIESQENAERKLLFELPLFYYPRHLYPDDGLIQCQCSQFFRRDEIGQHQQFVHAGIDSLLSAQRLSRRCPFAMYGCNHISSRLRMPQSDWKLTLVKGALATLPGTNVIATDVNGKESIFHLTTLPVKVLVALCTYLDPLSLSSLAQTCRHFRNIVATTLQQRGMVTPVWERSNGGGDTGDDEYDEYDVSWTIVRYRWTLSTYAHSVPLESWVQEDAAKFDQHMRRCKFSRGDRLEHGEQWKPLTGLVDVKAIEFASDSEFEADESDEETESDQETPDVPIAATTSVHDSKTKGVAKKRSVFRKINHRKKDGDAFDMALAVDELLGDEDVDIAEDNLDEVPEEPETVPEETETVPEEAETVPEEAETGEST